MSHKNNLFYSFVSFFIYSYSNAGLKTAQLEPHSEMGSTEILEKEASGSLSNGTSSNIEAAKRLAKRLYQLDRFKRSDVAKHLGKKYVPFQGWCQSASLQACVCVCVCSGGFGFNNQVYFVFLQQWI